MDEKLIAESSTVIFFTHVEKLDVLLECPLSGGGGGGGAGGALGVTPLLDRLFPPFWMGGGGGAGGMSKTLAGASFESGSGVLGSEISVII